MADPRAGTLAQPSDLVDVAHLVTAYYTLEPDPDDVDQQVAFGTSGHRGSSLKTAFNEEHIAADHAGDLRLPQGAGVRRPAVPRPRHPRTLGAGVGDGDRGAGRQRRDRAGRLRATRYTPTPAVSHAIIRANGGRTTGTGPRRRHRRHPVAQPARRRRLQVQPAARWPGRHRRDRGDRGPCQRADPGQPRGRPPDHVLPRPRCAARRTTSWARTSTTCRASSTSTRSSGPASGSARTRSAARASTTGARSPSGTGST